MTEEGKDILDGFNEELGNGLEERVFRINHRVRRIFGFESIPGGGGTNRDIGVVFL